MLKQMNALNNLGESIDDILYNFLVILGRFLAIFSCFKEAFYGNFDSCRSFLPTVSKSISSAEVSFTYGWYKNFIFSSVITKPYSSCTVGVLMNL